MSDTGTGAVITQALSTKLEEEFISPLTAVRGALEILRDFPDLSPSDQQVFIGNALKECERLEAGIGHLATTVYAAGERTSLESSRANVQNIQKKFSSRIKLLDEQSIIEVNFEDFEFNSSKLVNDFYDELEQVIEQSDRSWYFMVNYQNCSVWPEAWVAFAHRGKKINVGYSLGTVRYSEAEPDSSRSNSHSQTRPGESEMFDSRQQALNHIKKLQVDSERSGRQG